MWVSMGLPSSLASWANRPAFTKTPPSISHLWRRLCTWWKRITEAWHPLGTQMETPEHSAPSRLGWSGPGPKRSHSKDEERVSQRWEYTASFSDTHLIPRQLPGCWKHGNTSCDPEKGRWHSRDCLTYSIPVWDSQTGRAWAPLESFKLCSKPSRKEESLSCRDWWHFGILAHLWQLYFGGKFLWAMFSPIINCTPPLRACYSS